jgi:hypothetical protein
LRNSIPSFFLSIALFFLPGVALNKHEGITLSALYIGVLSNGKAFLNILLALHYIVEMGECFEIKTTVGFDEGIPYNFFSQLLLFFYDAL